MTFESVSDALRRYEEQLIRRGVREHFAAGLSLSEIAELERDVGFRFSEDVRAVWSWHNGVTEPDAPFLTGRSLIVPYYALVNLRDAVKRGAAVVRAAQFAGEAVEGVDRWIELCTGNDPFVIDSSDPERADSSTLGLVFGGGVNEIPHVSVTERVELWIEAFEIGAWSIDEDGHWHEHEAMRTERMVQLL
jgi:hypothetical protein